MDIDQYSYCPCGSGKKFKWCCQHIYKDIERAFVQLQDGQQDSALRIINEITQAHPKNPEVWGQKAAAYLYIGDTEQAEEALNKAFELNPNYPFGLLTRARLRAEEGEYTGALILARKAAEAYHPEALDYLAEVYTVIYQLEGRRNRPIAAHAALRILIHCQPGEQEFRAAEQTNFGPESRLPACARADYTLLPPPPTLSAERRKAWDQVLGQVQTPRLQAIATAFEQLTTQDATDAPAWFNLALAQAWLGENRKSLDALERYVALEADEARAARAATLAQVLLTGAGLENDADWKQFAVEYQLRDPRPMLAVFKEWHDSGRLIVQPTEEQNVLMAIVLEDVGPAIVTTATVTAPPTRRLGGYVLMAPPLLRLWGPEEGALLRMCNEIRMKTGGNLGESPVQVGATNFSDVVVAALSFVSAPGQTPEEARQMIVDHAGRYFEEEWVQRPLKYLAGNTPLDAAGHAVLRKKLLGVIQFIEDCAKIGVLGQYDFGRLRHKLGLVGAPATTPTLDPAPGATDVSRMNTEELAALPVESLSDELLEQAFQAARTLQAGEVATRFGTALVGRPVPAGSPPADRYPVFSYLVQHSLGEGNMDMVLDLVNEGQKQDCEHNEGRRRNDYELHRADLHVRRREPDQAQDVFIRLIERTPENLKVRGKAAQGMLSLGRASQALEFAEAAVEEARRQHDRDAEGQLLELIEDAKRRKK